MKKIKIYALLDKESDELISYEEDNCVVFSKRKKDVFLEKDSKIVEAILEIKFKGIDY